MLNLILFAFVVAFVCASPTPQDLDSYTASAEQQSSACASLNVKFPVNTYNSGSQTFEKENTNFYSTSAVLSPHCILTPKSTKDVAEALTVVRIEGSKFAVRGGGHMPIAGAASTNNGVLFAMDQMNSCEVITSGVQRLARIGSGQRWVDVYNCLAPQNLLVIGGRFAPVGVGGLLLGGGVSYFASSQGWASDHVVNYELVTADSKILQVNAKSYPDLFWALKGGSSNYGIVTKYDLEVYPLLDVYAGFVFQDEANIPGLVKAISDFVDPVNGGALDNLGALDATLTYDSKSGTSSGMTMIFYNGTGPSGPAAFSNFTKLPATTSTLGPRSFTDWISETASFGNTPTRKLWASFSLKANPAAVQLVSELYKEVVPNFHEVTNGTFTCTFQPFTQSFLDAAHKNGESAISLDPKDGPMIVLLLATDYPLSSDDAFVDKFLKELIAALETKSKAAGLYYPFIYLNDAGAWQKTLSYYGGGKSLSRMYSIAQKYDEGGVFQRNNGGAFKLSLEAFKK